VQHDAPVKAETVFELASLTKAMTAAAIMLLVEEGKVGLDRSITEYLDDPPPAWRPMTVTQSAHTLVGTTVRGARVRRDDSTAALRGRRERSLARAGNAMISGVGREPRCRSKASLHGALSG
jgi:CubicO group peptidase (beta-lactamase class C family)